MKRGTRHLTFGLNASRSTLNASSRYAFRHCSVLASKPSLPSETVVAARSSGQWGLLTSQGRKIRLSLMLTQFGAPGSLPFPDFSGIKIHRRTSDQEGDRSADRRT